VSVRSIWRRRWLGVGLGVGLGLGLGGCDGGGRGERAGAETGARSWAYSFDAMGRPAGVAAPPRDALGRATVFHDRQLGYGADGRLARASRGDDELGYLYDEEGRRIAKRHNGVPVEGYSDGSFITDAMLLEPLRIERKIVALLQNGQSTLIASDARATPLADGDGTSELAGPFGERDTHPDVAPALDYAAAGWDADLGAARMGVRDYDPSTRQFLTPDPLFLEAPERCVGSPVECNLYGYARNQPADRIDPTGTCSAPVVGAGQVGICFETFIAAPRLGGIGLGDHRGFDGNNPKLTAKYRLQAVFDTATGDLVSKTEMVAKSQVLFRGFYPMQGTKASLLWRDSSDNYNVADPNVWHFMVAAYNGFKNFPGAPHEPILALFRLQVRGDDVRVLGGSRSAFPSMAFYSYKLGPDGTLQTRTHFEKPVHDPSDLGKFNAEIPPSPEPKP
jgi:RHS repeat-associated protein